MSFKGQRNRYTCRDCGQTIVTVDTDEGVTPFLLGCRTTEGCKGLMQSSMYRGVTDVPTFEWRKPTPVELIKASRGMRDHFSQGGLDIYPLAAPNHPEQSQ